MLVGGLNANRCLYVLADGGMCLYVVVRRGGCSQLEVPVTSYRCRMQWKVSVARFISLQVVLGGTWLLEMLVRCCQFCYDV